MEKQIAKLNYLRMAPRKVRLVASLLRGLSVNEAEAQLILMRKRAAKPILKLLRSAVAGAKSKKGMDIDKLIVSSIMVDGGPMLKRYMARAQGRMAEIQKKMSHITMTLVESEKVTKKYTIVVPKKDKHLVHEENAKKADVPKPKREKKVAKKGTSVVKKVFSKNTKDTSGDK